MAPLKLFVCSVTANPETKKRVQRAVMVLDGLGIPFDTIDITKPEHQEERAFMRENAVKEGVRGPPLPPQFFYNEEYLGNYDDFEASVESDTIAQFLRLLPDVMELPASNEGQEVEETTAEKADEGEGEEGEEDEEWDEDEDEEDEEKKEEVEETKESESSPPEKAEDDKKQEEKEEVVEGEDEELEGEDEEWDEEEGEEEEEA